MSQAIIPSVRTAFGVLPDLRLPSATPRIGHLLLCIVLAGPIYGFAMGSFEPSASRMLYPVYSAIKMPLMILATSAVCLPGFVVLSSILNLRDELRQSLRAILCSQAAFAVALASLAPLTVFSYISGVDIRGALLTSGVMFFIATLVAQSILWRRYRPLIARSRRHLVMLVYWLGAYVFVGIQMGWMLRPFVGTPGIAAAFLRDEPFSNAYLVVLRLIAG